ncbi:MAG: hypothetical protein GY952_14185 [Rhodobacteraceae bacterium]|nr:hypothetical protein [Paracoccaceae bacterium]
MTLVTILKLFVIALLLGSILTWLVYDWRVGVAWGVTAGVILNAKTFFLFIR